MFSARSGNAISSRITATNGNDRIGFFMAYFPLNSPCPPTGGEIHFTAPAMPSDRRGSRDGPIKGQKRNGKIVKSNRPSPWEINLLLNVIRRRKVRARSGCAILGVLRYLQSD